MKLTKLNKLHKLLSATLIIMSLVIINFIFFPKISYADSTKITPNLFFVGESINHPLDNSPPLPNNGCVGGSGKDSKVGLWDCTGIKRYQWQIHSSEVPGWYYIVNAENGKCLSRYSKGNKIRYYNFSEEPCKLSDYRLWRFIDKDGNLVTPSYLQFFRRSNVLKLELKKSKAGCLSQRLTDPDYTDIVVDSLLTTQNCNEEVRSDYPVNLRFFTIIPVDNT